MARYNFSPKQPFPGGGQQGPEGEGPQPHPRLPGKPSQPTKPPMTRKKRPPQYGPQPVGPQKSPPHPKPGTGAGNRDLPPKPPTGPNKKRRGGFTPAA